MVFVLDRSGSMGGWKMVAARRALARMVDTLTDHDRFTVLAFDDAIETPPGAGQALVAATDRQRFQAVEFLAGSRPAAARRWRSRSTWPRTSCCATAPRVGATASWCW